MPEARSALGAVSGGTRASVIREVAGAVSPLSGWDEAGPGGRCASVLIPPPVLRPRTPTVRLSGQARSSPRVGHSTGWNAPRGNVTGGPGGSAQNIPLPCGNPVWQAQAMTPRAADRARYDRATAQLDAPLALVDLDAFDANAEDLVRRAGGKPIRVASKSVRCRALLERVLERDGFAGIMSFTLAESLWLARSGFDDVLLAYPSADRAGFAELAADPKLAAAVTVMVDDPAQLELIDRARDGGTEEVRICLELDTSLKLLGGRVRIGALRSPCARRPNWPSWPGRSRVAPASGWWG